MKSKLFCQATRNSRMTSVMIRFEKFLMKTHFITAIEYSRRNVILLKQGANVLATAYLTRGKITDMTFDKSANKWASLLRFHVALRNSPVRMYHPSVNHQNTCSTPNCFKFLKNEFSDEWDRFSALENSELAVMPGRCIIEKLNHFADTLEGIL